MEDNWIEVFRAGEQQDSKGVERNWTPEVLESIAEKYNNQPEVDRHEAPVVIGHPVNNSPAYAWVEQLRVDGDTLLARYKQVDTEFAEIVKEGRYKKVSIALYPDLTLRHVGYLGAVPPAVKGLKDSEFNESLEFETFEVEPTINTSINNTGGGAMPEMGKMCEELIAWLRTTFNEEIANQTAAQIEELKKKYAGEAAPADAPPAPAQPGVENSEFNELRKKLEIVERDNRSIKFNEYFNNKAREGRLIPAQRAMVEAAFEAVRGTESLEFSEGDKTVQVSGEQLLKNLIESFPPQIEFSEFARGGDAVRSKLEEENKIIEEYNKRRK